ncbi:HET-domain-containing protein [Lentithecium fluviatile CBS 122367]|uniref:HET-domain-containing protein n=1 Tax=Lentithecium fluviatile CBS 122367 TaxID=1168545 RepID=A0A6G1IFV9_9PLEO|nr:HET-domain-containing protein [Lentithecium fluviatile CBS 122367]
MNPDGLRLEYYTMCNYDRVRYSCSHIYWSNVKSTCERVTKPGDQCSVKKVRKDGYFRSSQRCARCDGRYSITPTSRPAVPLSPNQHCGDGNCYLAKGHVGPHRASRWDFREVVWMSNIDRCPAEGCDRATGHPLPHGELIPTARTIALRFEENVRRQEEETLRRLSLLVLNAMGIYIRPVASYVPRFAVQQRVKDHNAAEAKRRQKMSESPMVRPPINGLYAELNLSNREIRLFDLFPQSDNGEIRGVFHHVTLSSWASYTALSYTWGDPTDVRQITVDGKIVDVRKNLWEFLHQQSSLISQPKRFWIDALCIDQSNVHERNHQVNLMKDIYVGADEVYVWLGAKSGNSGIAMDYIERKAARGLKPKGPGFQRIWTREEGRALRDLCERPYWRRMWVIQEIVHAKKIAVWCGPQSFTWDFVESLYLKLKGLQDTHWFPHHEFAIQVLQSSAAVMVWQRAHCRHPETPIPSLRTLIEVFRHWQCAEIRDKVFALVSMASPDTTILPDYAQSARDVYFAVCEKHPEAGWAFENMLSQVLGLSERDIKLSGRDLVEYKVHPPERWILQRRAKDDW